MAHSDNARTQDAEAGWFQIGAIQHHLDIISARQSKGQLDGLAGKVPAAKLTTWVQILGSQLRESTSVFWAHVCHRPVHAPFPQHAHKMQILSVKKNTDKWSKSNKGATELGRNSVLKVQFKVLKKRCLAYVTLYLNTGVVSARLNLGSLWVHPRVLFPCMSLPAHYCYVLFFDATLHLSSEPLLYKNQGHVSHLPITLALTSGPVSAI